MVGDGAVLGLSLLSGSIVANIHEAGLHKKNPPFVAPNEIRLIGEVVSQLNPHPTYTSFRLNTFGIIHQDSFIPFSVPIQCKLDSGIVADFGRFDTLYATVFLYPLKTKYEQYQRYLTRNGIHYGAKINKYVKGGQHLSLFAKAENIRKIFSLKIRHYIPETAMAGIASAMFLGENDYLQESLTSSYADAGISHILAISGQHITMIFMLLNLLLNPLTLLKNGKKGKHWLIIGLLLLYMILCGAAASVIRSVMMFIIILIARIFRKQYHILNLLGLAALIQILWNPFVIYNLGFQLSYAAVASIVIFYPVFERYFMTGNKIIDIIFSWVGITLSAQILTLPFILINFGRFPTYFILSNVVLAPIAYLTVLSGFLLLLFCYIPGLNFVLGYVTWGCLKLMTLFADWIAQLPYAVITAPTSPGIFILSGILLLTLGFLLLPKWIQQQASVPNFDGLSRWGLD